MTPPPIYACPQCRTQYDYGAQRCRECGASLATPRKSSQWKIVAIVAFVILLGISINMCFARLSDRQPRLGTSVTPGVSPPPSLVPTPTLDPKDIQKAEAALRRIIGAEAERNMLSNGMDVTVTVSGPENRAIKFQYILWSRPLIYKLVNEEGFLEKLRAQGFRHVTFTDGYDSTWRFKYNEKKGQWD